MFGCHTKVVEFFLRNGNLSAGLEYLARLGKDIGFDFIHFLREKFGPANELKGDQKFIAQQDSLQILQSDIVSLE